MTCERTPHPFPPSFYSHTNPFLHLHVIFKLLFQPKGISQRRRRKKCFRFSFMNVEPTEMTHQNPAQPAERAPQLPEEPNNKSQLPDDVVHVETGCSSMETCQYDRVLFNNEESSLLGRRTSAPEAVKVTKDAMRAEESSEEDIGRERLKRHRIEVAGRVWIPEIWGQEELLKDWIDCSAFDASLVPSGIMSARAALVEEGRRANSGGFRIENRY